jgi:hypothetical protein
MSRTLTCWVLALATLAPAARAVAAPDKAKAPAIDLFTDASDLTAKLRKAVKGRVMIDEMTLYRDSANLFIQDPNRKENLDSYSYRDGKLELPEPVKLSGDYTQADLDAGVFPLESVDFTLIPTMIEDAKTRLKMPDGKVTVLTLKRGDPDFNQFDVRWHVGVSDARHTGSVEYDLKGKKKSVWKD